MTRTPTIGVLALQGAVAEHERALKAAGAHTVKVRRAAELQGLDGLIIPGGESTAIARLAAPVGLMPAIRQRHDEGMALFGTCAGLILMADRVLDAEALEGFDRVRGLDVVVRRNAYGSQLDSFETELETQQIPDSQRRLPAVFIRAPIIEDVSGKDVEILAQAELGAGGSHPVVVRQGNRLAASFHPELTADHRLHDLFVTLSGE
ncbi:pyridoxal 5'-phosphate synthase glutaminase subunit PdxT [Nesterenkonia sp. NBAIMH1]|uniref:pyridoxal 5'-phosphate synthase glutaminase subunit PdxT n=1 Tax=Nesterenkonia sp. NBAIMH1 TaxID=2600320 RepID=UPI0011B5D85D|nr:pyridoxal 5'-phosphate synthase glutaminase subunit PdxT [Nesterenkonia sp. NBAIMH1]